MLHTEPGPIRGEHWGHVTSSPPITDHLAPSCSSLPTPHSRGSARPWSGLKTGDNQDVVNGYFDHFQFILIIVELHLIIFRLLYSTLRYLMATDQIVVIFISAYSIDGLLR